eukprot:COSAG02_NODE_65792_length_257_cov_0.651899_1_plen_46_part_10
MMKLVDMHTSRFQDGRGTTRASAVCCVTVVAGIIVGALLATSEAAA